MKDTARRALLAAALVALAGTAQAADAPALVTLVEGSGTVLDGTRLFPAVPGLRVGPGSIVGTTPNTNLLRIEFADGSMLDLGADSHALLLPPGLAGSGPRAPAFYLLQGWAKHTTTGVAKAGGQLSFAAEVLQPSGITVSRADGEGLQLFIESGSLQLLERRLKPAATLPLKAGEFYARDGGDKGRLSPRPPPGFLQGVPRSFRDTIPPRAAQLKAKPADPKPLAAPTYAVLKPWLAAEPVIRREFPKRFVTLARDSAFREGLVKNLPAHPEWEPVLFPPKPPSNPASPYLRPSSPS